MKEYTEEYAMWLEEALIKSLTKNEKISNKQLENNLKNINIKYVDEFVGYLLDINNKNMRSTIEFLDTYPVGLESDLYGDEVQKVNKWEIDVITTLFSRLRNEHKYITDKVYTDFFDKVMKKYEPYFLYNTYMKILPENVFNYWFCRIDKSIPWCEINNYENIAVDLIAMVESEYLDINKSMFDYEYLRNDTDC